MIGLFPALQARFNANAALKAVGRKLYEGYGGVPRQSGPHTEVTIDLVGDLDTFTSDIPVYECAFAFFSGSVQSTDAATWCNEMIRSFDKGTLTISGATCASISVAGQPHPRIDESGRYVAGCTVTVILQRTTMVPATRGV